MRETLARNLGIHRQIIFLDNILSAASITAVLLKGAALIEALPELMHTRTMEDIDLLVCPASACSLYECLERAGYRRVPGDPAAWQHPDYPESIDINEGLWYLDVMENRELCAAAGGWRIPGLASLTHLPPDEFSVHLLAHACIHHGRPADTAQPDRDAVHSRWPDLTAQPQISALLARHGMHALRAYAFQGIMPGRIAGRCMRSAHPLSGHILRWLFLPAKKKASYIFRTLFPSTAFVRSRYNCRSTFGAIIMRVIRPGLLVAMLLRVLFMWGKREKSKS